LNALLDLQIQRGIAELFEQVCARLERRNDWELLRRTGLAHSFQRITMPREREAGSRSIVYARGASASANS
jgi:hypothetical protein